MITLISADWLPHFICPSRGCLALVSGIIRMPFEPSPGIWARPLSSETRRTAHGPSVKAKEMPLPRAGQGDMPWSCCSKIA